MKKITKFIAIGLSVFLSASWINTTFAVENDFVSAAKQFPDWQIDKFKQEFKKGEQVVSASFVNVDRVYDSNSAATVFNYTSKESRVFLGYYYALSNKLAIGAILPYQLSNTHEASGSTKFSFNEFKGEEESGIDDISLAVLFRLNSPDNLPSMIEFDISLDNASDSEGQSESKSNGTVSQPLKKYGAGKGYKTYSLTYHIGIVKPKWMIEFSPNYTKRENSSRKKMGDHYGLSAEMRYKITDSAKALVGFSHNIFGQNKYDTAEYKGYSENFFAFGTAISLSSQNQITLSYAYSGGFELKRSDVDSFIKFNAVSGLKVSWATQF